MTPATARAWRVAAASVRGRAHLAHGLPCQDAHGWRVLSKGELVAVVADGAGSAARAAEGARTAADAAVAALEAGIRARAPRSEAAWTATMDAAIAAARLTVFARAEAEGAPARDFATTLTCAVAANGWLVVGQVGDGVVVADTADEGLVTATRPQKGEYANEAVFLTAEGALDVAEVHAARRRVVGLALTTDGLLRLALDLPRHAPHAPFFRPLLDAVAAADDPAAATARLAGWLASARVTDRTDDDTTLVLAVRARGRAAPPWRTGRTGGRRRSLRHR